MREIVVVSGKGGTGKTTLTSSFALLGNDKVIVDADVDAPDLHIILSPRVIEAYTFKGHRVARIRKDLCDECGLCRELCRFDAIDEGFSVDEILCEGCALCYFACPRDAVDMVERESGVWFVAQAKNGSIMVHARLYPGEENSGKLITTLKNRAREIAQDQGTDLILVDGPPGIGCPVISSVTGATDLVAVVEPTLSGIHDAERLLELAKHFGVRVWVVVNRFDINMELCQRIEEWASSKGVNFLGRIPTDPEIPKLQMEGKAPVEGDCLSGEMIAEIWEKLLEEV